MNITYMKLREEPYNKIASGTKTVEIRLYDEKRAALNKGDLIIFQKQPYLHEMMYKKVGSVVRFSSFSDLFAAYNQESLGCGEDDSAETFARAMGRYYSESDEAKYGVCAIELLPYDGGYEINVTRARRINERDIEIYFDGDFEFGAEPKTEEYTVSQDGTPLALEERYGRDGHVHFCRMTTLRLRERLPVDGAAPTVTVTLRGKEYAAPFEDYYKYKLTTKSGVTVKGSDALILGMKTIERAGELVDIQLSACPEIAAQMVESGASLSVFGRGECAYHVPEHREGYEVGSLYVEGFGGIACSITECNVWHWHRDCETRPDPNYTTHYKNENILIHEFGHGVKIAGIDRMEDRSLATEFQMLYRHARAAGLWPNTYAISNSDEYFATLSAIWFNVMNECSKDDGWDGTRGPINTRRELYNYDIDAYKFFSKIYPHRDLDGAWTPVPDTVHVTGLPDEPEVDFTGRNYTLNYPEPQEGAGELSFGEEYKISIPRGGMIIDTGASDGYTGVWYDYSGDTADMGSMTFTFEPVEGQPCRFNENKSVYTAFIKGAEDGWLSVNDAGNRITAGDREHASVFTVALDTRNIARIECGGRRLVIDGAPDLGTPLTLAKDEKQRGGFWRLTKFSDMRRRALFIHDGMANGCERGVFAESGETIALSAPETKDGKRFSNWRISKGEIADANSPTTTCTMPETDAVVWAEYK